MKCRKLKQGLERFLEKSLGEIGCDLKKYILKPLQYKNRYESQVQKQQGQISSSQYLSSLNLASPISCSEMSYFRDCTVLYFSRNLLQEPKFPLCHQGKKGASWISFSTVEQTPAGNSISILNCVYECVSESASLKQFERKTSSG